MNMQKDDLEAITVCYIAVSIRSLSPLNPILCIIIIIIVIIIIIIIIKTVFIHGILITKEWFSKEPCALNLVEKKAKTEITNIINYLIISAKLS